MAEFNIASMCKNVCEEQMKRVEEQKKCIEMHAGRMLEQTRREQAERGRAIKTATEVAVVAGKRALDWVANEMAK